MVRTVVLIAVAGFLAACATTSSQEGASQDYGQYQDGTDHPAVKMLFGQADDAAQAGNWSAALTYLDQARRIEPRNPYVLYRQAKAYAAAGDSARARQLLERARVFAHEDDEMLSYLLYELEFQL
jgi:Flp pilus assembly protein TadD